ncbi:MAG: hypothetical protein H6983_17820 [Ectothiorhodospiraceae bacterium]|nr:hypothetical protein [Chromatiales bacterium]MCP5156035.1 hypothetical protein [Ectothiorhodospiraceae bacterium]
MRIQGTTAVTPVAPSSRERHADDTRASHHGTGRPPAAAVLQGEWIGSSASPSGSQGAAGPGARAEATARAAAWEARLGRATSAEVASPTWRAIAAYRATATLGAARQPEYRVDLHV